MYTHTYTHICIYIYGRNQKATFCHEWSDLEIFDECFLNEFVLYSLYSRQIMLNMIGKSLLLIIEKVIALIP